MVEDGEVEEDVEAVEAASALDGASADFGVGASAAGEQAPSARIDARMRMWGAVRISLSPTLWWRYSHLRVLQERLKGQSHWL